MSCDQINLRRIKVEEFCGFVFVNMDEDAAPMSDGLEEYEANMLSFHPDPSKLRFVCETEIIHDCNWKLYVENYNECYHCPTVHASSLTRGVLEMDGYTTVPKGRTIWHDGKAQTKSNMITIQKRSRARLITVPIGSGRMSRWAGIPVVILLSVNGCRCPGTGPFTAIVGSQVETFRIMMFGH